MQAVGSSFSLRMVPVDWATATNADRVFTLRVQPSGATATGIDIAKANGFCVNWRRLAQGAP